MRVPIAPTFSVAWAALHDAMIDKFGAVPGPRNDLIVQVLPCPHKGSERRGTVLLGYPRGDGVHADNAVAVYFGDPLVPEMA